MAADMAQEKAGKAEAEEPKDADSSKDEESKDGDWSKDEESKAKALFEVYDYDLLSADDHLATLTVSLADALAGEGQEAKAYDLAVVAGQKPRKQRKGKTLGKSGKYEADEEAGPVVSRLYLGFQAIVPCPMQLKCVVEEAHGLPIPASTLGSVAASVRMRFVEGNPLVSQETVFKTRTIQQTLRPVWNEKFCVAVPQWVWEVESKRENSGHSKTVRAQWEHERTVASDPVIVIDIWDSDVFNEHDFLCRGHVPFSEAVAAATAKASEPGAP